MNWEQKLAAFKALGEAHLEMRKPGDWYVADSINVGGDGCLVGAYGNGATPQQAVEDHWQKLVVDLPLDRHLHSRHAGVIRRVRWNGYMWQDIAPESVDP